MPGPLTEAIASIFREAVESRGLLQREVAEAIGQSQTQVSRYLRGEVTMDAEEIDKMCRLVGLKITDVIARADSATTSRLGDA